MCLRTVERHETPVRTVAFSHDGNFLASASEDDFIDICDPVSSKRVCEPIFVRAPMNALAWHPKTHALAYAGDKEDLSKRKREALNLDEDLDAKASRMEEERVGKLVEVLVVLVAVGMLKERRWRKMTETKIAKKKRAR